MLATQGGRFGRWARCVLDPKPVFTLYLADLERCGIKGGTRPLGKHGMRYWYDHCEVGTGARMLVVNDERGGQAGSGVLWAIAQCWMELSTEVRAHANRSARIVTRPSITPASATELGILDLPEPLPFPPQ